MPRVISTRTFQNEVTMTVNQRFFQAIKHVEKNSEYHGGTIYKRIMAAYLVNHYKDIGSETLHHITNDLFDRGSDYVDDLGSYEDYSERC